MYGKGGETGGAGRGRKKHEGTGDFEVKRESQKRKGRKALKEALCFGQQGDRQNPKRAGEKLSSKKARTTIAGKHRNPVSRISIE